MSDVDIGQREGRLEEERIEATKRSGAQAVLPLEHDAERSLQLAHEFRNLLANTSGCLRLSAAFGCAEYFEREYGSVSAPDSLDAVRDVWVESTPMTSMRRHLCAINHQTASLGGIA